VPELPEVEVVRRGLEAHVLDGVFEDVEVLHPRANRGQDVPLADLLVGARITAVRRRGKYLWLDFGEDALYVHLGMSGQMLIGPTSSPHVRIRARVSGRELNFVDQRTFGRWLYTPQVAGVPVPVAHIARDPLEADFDRVATARLIRRKRSAIKAVLLNQEVVSGIGNIYADEALWQAGIAPGTSRGPSTPTAARGSPAAGAGRRCGASSWAGGRRTTARSASTERRR
jgi:formamidopyrimidine-DNA glycosylase